MQADEKPSARNVEGGFVNIGAVPGVFESKATESDGKPNDAGLTRDANETKVAKHDLKASNIAALPKMGDGGFEKQALVLLSGCGEPKASDGEQGYQEAVHYTTRRLNRKCGKPNSRWDFGKAKKRITGMKEADKLQTEWLGRQTTTTTTLPTSLKSDLTTHQVNRLYGKPTSPWKSGMDPRIVARILEVLPEGEDGIEQVTNPPVALGMTTMTPARLASLESTTPQPSSRKIAEPESKQAPPQKLMTSSPSPKMPQGKPVPEATPQLQVRKTDFLPKIAGLVLLLLVAVCTGMGFLGLEAASGGAHGEMGDNSALMPFAETRTSATYINNDSSTHAYSYEQPDFSLGTDVRWGSPRSSFAELRAWPFSTYQYEVCGRAPFHLSF